MSKIKEDTSASFKQSTTKLSKRARIVLEHIKQHGQITTEDLENMGYKHPPRAARDVREAGIPLKTIKVKSSTGKSIAAYKLDKGLDVEHRKQGGRRLFSKAFKKRLVAHFESKCAMCNTEYANRYLQIDHRVPYEIVGDENTEEHSLDPFMLLCATCNRRKSWSCEHCDNWNEIRDPKVCQTCYWGSPEDYTHVALCPIRQLIITWIEDEVNQYNAIETRAKKENIPVPELIKQLLAQTLNRNV